MTTTINENDLTLEEIFENDATCLFGDNNVEWLAVFKCCGRRVLLCDPHKEAAEEKLRKNYKSRVRCWKCDANLGYLTRFSDCATLTRI